jgi:uncharacterized membrane protein YeiH
MTGAMAAELVPGFSNALVIIDLFGIAVFAISGALVAAEKKLDFITFVFFAVVTGVGGGTLRDLLIGAPVFWVHNNATLLICIAAALLVWFISRRFSGKALPWFDAAGLAAYAVYGSAKALGFGVAPVPAFAMGVLTACFGGIVRDVLAGEPTILMRKELYVTPAALAAGLFVGMNLLNVSTWLAAAIAVVSGFVLRGGAILRGWSLPVSQGLMRCSIGCKGRLMDFDFHRISPLVQIDAWGTLLGVRRLRS